jgi:hypothetical protein
MFAKLKSPPQLRTFSNCPSCTTKSIGLVFEEQNKVVYSLDWETLGTSNTVDMMLIKSV